MRQRAPRLRSREHEARGRAGTPAGAAPAPRLARASESGVGPPGAAAASRSAPARRRARARAVVRTVRWWSGVLHWRELTSHAAMSWWFKRVATSSAESVCPPLVKLREAPWEAHSRIPSGREGSALALRRASPRSWWSTEQAFWTRSSRLQSKTEALGTVGYKLRVDVDERSAGGWRLEAVSRHRTAGCSETPSRAPRS